MKKRREEREREAYCSSTVDKDWSWTLRIFESIWTTVSRWGTLQKLNSANSQKRCRQDTCNFIKSYLIKKNDNFLPKVIWTLTMISTAGKNKIILNQLPPPSLIHSYTCMYTHSCMNSKILSVIRERIQHENVMLLSSMSAQSILLSDFAELKRSCIYIV